jgi:hypothetical protein
MTGRLEAYATVPAVVAVVIMVAGSVLATAGTHPVAVALVTSIGVILVLITIDTGSHSMTIFSGAFLMMALALAIGRLSLGGPLPWTIAALIVLGFADGIRLSFAQRRSGVVDRSVVGGVMIGSVLVAVGSMATGVAVLAVTESTANLSWMLVPLALLLAVVGAVGLAVTVSRSPGPFDKRRWRPGERLLAPARDASDDPSFPSSLPPPPR